MDYLPKLKPTVGGGLGGLPARAATVATVASADTSRLPLDIINPINSAEDVYTAPDSSVWLKSGIVETDPSVYPNATVTGGNVGLASADTDTATSLPVYVQVQQGSEDIPINGTLPINSAEDIYTDTIDGVWLKSGVVETDAAVYPDATFGFAYSGTSFSVAGEETSPSGITWDGTYFWIIGAATDAVYKYNGSGVYQSVSFSVSAQDVVPQGITWDGTYFWVLGLITKAAYKYNSSGVYQSVSWSVAGESTNPQGITWDGTYFWVVDWNRSVYKYSLAGVYQSVTWSAVSEMTHARDIAWDGTYFWVAADATDAIYKYTAAGVYTGFSLSSTTEDSDIEGLVSVDADLWTVGTATDTAYKYIPIGAGLSAAATETDTGLPIYQRVK